MRNKLAFIVPYRNRYDQLHTFYKEFVDSRNIYIFVKQKVDTTDQKYP